MLNWKFSDTTDDVLCCIEACNNLIKHQIKDLSNEEKTELSGIDTFPDIEVFKSEVLSILESGVFPDNFIDSINRIYLLSEANNDLSVEFPAIRKPLALLSPAILEFSLDVFQFLREYIFYRVLL